MSLLSGIRFVPKDERSNLDSDDSSTDSESVKHHKKKRKHKHLQQYTSENKHKKKKKSDNELKKKKKHHKDKHRGSPTEYDHAAEIRYMESIVESEGLEIDSLKSKSNMDFEKYNMYDNNNNRGSMINYSKLAFEETPLSEGEDEEECDSTPTHNESSAATSVASGGVDNFSDSKTRSKLSTAPVVSNQSVADMLRARLQKGEKLVSAPSAVIPLSGTEHASGRERNSRNTGYNQRHHKQDDVDIASFMTVGELKWMSAYKLKGRERGSTVAGAPSLPVPGEKNSSLADLVAMEKSGGGLTGGGGDIDKIFADNIIKRGSGYRGSELGLGSGAGASRGSGGDRAGMDEEEGMGVTSWLGAEAEVDSDDNNDDARAERGKKAKSTAPSKRAIDKMKKREKDLVNGVDMTMFQQREDKMTEQQIHDRIMKKALAKKKAFSQTVFNCFRCVAGRRFRQDLVLCTGSHFQLCLKSRDHSLVPGWHCELVPLVHSSSVMLAEKEGEGECIVRAEGQGVEGGLFKELERFKACLQRMFERRGQGVVFCEAATKSGASRHHTTVDVVPVPRGAEGEVHMSFKQAFRDSGDAFSTHKKRIIPTSSVSKTFQSCIPAHFPYLLVEWGDAAKVPAEKNSSEMCGSGGQVGLVYILDAAISINDAELDKEDTGHFNTSFCLDVMAGVLEIDQLERRMIRQRGDRGGSEREREDTKRFREEWEVFDWTTYDFT